MWNPGEVVQKCNEPRSYLVKSHDGGILRRNRVHIRDIPQPKKVSFNDDLRENSVAKNVEDMPHSSNTNVNSRMYEPCNPDFCYKTRSGREIKKPKKFDM